MQLAYIKVSVSLALAKRTQNFLFYGFTCETVKQKIDIKIFSNVHKNDLNKYIKNGYL